EVLGGNREALKEIAMSPSDNQLNHATWECKYHVVFTPKYRNKLLFGQIRRYWAVYPRARPAQGVPVEEGPLDARACAHTDINPADVFGGGGERVFERERLDLIARGGGGPTVGSTTTEASVLMKPMSCPRIRYLAGCWRQSPCLVRSLETG